MNDEDKTLYLELSKLAKGGTKSELLAEINQLKTKQLLKIEFEDVLLTKKEIINCAIFFPCFYLSEEDSQKNKSNFRGTSINKFYRLEEFCLISIHEQEQFRGKLPEFKTAKDFIESSCFIEICSRSLEKRITSFEEDLKSA